MLCGKVGNCQVELDQSKAAGSSPQEKLEEDLHRSLQAQLKILKGAKNTTKKIALLISTRKIIADYKRQGLQKKFKNVFQSAADFETFFSPLYSLKIEKAKKTKKTTVSEQKCREKRQELYLLFDPQLSDSEQRPAAKMANDFLTELCKVVPPK